MERFRHLAAIGNPRVLAFGSTLGELFENAAAGMFDLTYDVASIPPRYSRPLVVSGDTSEELLSGWLTALLALARRERLALSYFTVDRLEEGGVQGSAAGMPEDDRIGRGMSVLGVGPIPEGSIVEIPDGFWVELVFVGGPAPA